MGWLIAIGLLLLTALLPVGIRAIYDANGAHLWMIAGPIRIKLYPGGNKAKDKKKTSDEEKKAPNSAPQKNASGSGGSIADFFPLLQRVLRFLGHFRRKLRVDIFQLFLMLAGDDPADLAVNYGRTWASVSSLIPLLDRCFIIKKRDIDVHCDFTADKTTVSARLDLTITIGRLIGITVWHGTGFMREYFKILKSRKGGTRI